MEDYLLHHQIFNAQELMQTSPPQFSMARKKAVYQIACPERSVHAGQIQFSRYSALSLPENFPTPTITACEARPDFFTYDSRIPEKEGEEWHLNFAHSDLFCAYNSPLLAQDELQVLEHPALGAVREYFVKRDLLCNTVENGVPTPILIRGVERRCRIDTSPNAKAGRPNGLYGNQFAHASMEAIEAAVTPIIPPTRSNILAMEAPPGGYGIYTTEQITYILQIAFTGFSAVVYEANSLPVTIHTGFWGCGAYGGNRVLMTILQTLAAELAGVNNLVFHTGDIPGLSSYQDAQNFLRHEKENANNAPELIDLLQAGNFRWGLSDGN
jgi:hypothetical protein